MSDWFKSSTFDSIKGLTPQQIAAGQRNTGNSGGNPAPSAVITQTQGAKDHKVSGKSNTGYRDVGGAELAARKQVLRSTTGTSPVQQVADKVSEIGQLMGGIAGVRSIAEQNRMQMQMRDMTTPFRALNGSDARNRSEYRPIQGKTISNSSNKQGYNQVGPGENAISWVKPSANEKTSNWYGNSADPKPSTYSPEQTGWLKDFTNRLNERIDPLKTTEIPWSPSKVIEALRGNPQKVPVSEWTGNVTSTYYDPRDKGLHESLDFKFMPNEPVLSFRGGQVVHVGFDNSRGNYVMVRDPQSGEVDTYSHFSSVTVQPGDLIGFGQEVGKAGNTGQSFGIGGGYHLDYTVAKDNNPVTAQRLYEIAGYDPKTNSINSDWANLYVAQKEWDQMQHAKVLAQETAMLNGLIAPPSYMPTDPNLELVRGY